MKFNRFAKPLILTTGIIASCAVFAEPKINSEEHLAIRSFLQQTIQDSSSFKDRFDAEVWLLSQSANLEQYIKNPQERLRILKAIHHEATQADLNPDIVLAVIQIESAFNRYAVSRVGAQGLMQVMPFWKNEIGRAEDNLTNELTNLKYGCRILQFYIQKEEGKGGLSMALARYNGSYPRTIYTEKVMDAWKDRWDTGAVSETTPTAIKKNSLVKN